MAHGNRDNLPITDFFVLRPLGTRLLLAGHLVHKRPYCSCRTGHLVHKRRS